MNFFRIIVNLFQFNRTNWKALVLCLATATVFWLFSALNKNHIANLRFPLYFNFDRERYVPMEMPQYIALNVSGNGWELLRNSLGVKVLPLEIKLDHPVEVKKIVASTLPSWFSSQLSELQIHHVLTDTLYIQVEPFDRHKFDVNVDITNISFRNGYGRIGPVILTPDTVHLRGPKSVIHELQDSIILVIQEKRISENYNEDIEIPVPDKVDRTPSVIHVSFEVGELVEVEKPIRLEFTNVPSKSKLSLVKDSVICKLVIPKRDQENIDSVFREIKAVVDLKNLTKGQSKLVPTITGLPSHIKIDKLDTLKITLY